MPMPKDPSNRFDRAITRITHRSSRRWSGTIQSIRSLNSDHATNEQVYVSKVPRPAYPILPGMPGSDNGFSVSRQVLSREGLKNYVKLKENPCRVIPLISQIAQCFAWSRCQGSWRSGRRCYLYRPRTLQCEPDDTPDP
jgi:hypothetical protein